MFFEFLRGFADFFHHFKEFLFIGDVDQTGSGKVNSKLYALSSVDLLALVNLDALNKSVDECGSKDVCGIRQQGSFDRLRRVRSRHCRFAGRNC